jgi:tetratricopeptide (TPR) repeat protein
MFLLVFSYCKFTAFSLFGSGLSRLGITILEMIIGKNPFIKSERKDILAVKINHNFIPTNLSQWLQEILLKATNPIPELRFQTATEFKEALLAKCVPYIFNKVRLNADKIFNAANKSLATKNWKKAINYIETGLEKYNNSTLGLLTAGKYYLKVHNILEARKYFEQAVKLNPAVNIKKELSSINIIEGNYSQAISNLQNHLQLQPVDWEAYNLLAECFYRIQRFDTILEIIESVIEEAKADCFWNNWYITKHCLDNNFVRLNREIGKKISNQHFLKLNFNIIRDLTESSIDNNNRWRRLLYQDFRFNKYTNKNICTIIQNDDKKLEFNEPIISIGRNGNNNYCIDELSVSRRHCVIVNYPNDVWIYDLGSKCGIYIDDQKVNGKQFLLGKHRIKVGSFEFDFYSTEGILI